MPGLDVHGERPLSATRLIDVSGSRVEHAKHRDNTVGFSICPPDDRVISSHIVDMKTDPSCPFRDLGTLLESVINTIDGISFVGSEKARRHLWSMRSSVE